MRKLNTPFPNRELEIEIEIEKEKAFNCHFLLCYLPFPFSFHITLTGCLITANASCLPSPRYHSSQKKVQDTCMT